MSQRIEISSMKWKRWESRVCVRIVESIWVCSTSKMNQFKTIKIGSIEDEDAQYCNDQFGKTQKFRFDYSASQTADDIAQSLSRFALKRTSNALQIEMISIFVSFSPLCVFFFVSFTIRPFGGTVLVKRATNIANTEFRLAWMNRPIGVPADNRCVAFRTRRLALTQFESQRLSTAASLPGCQFNFEWLGFAVWATHDRFRFPIHNNNHSMNIIRTWQWRVWLIAVFWCFCWFILVFSQCPTKHQKN